MKKRTMVSIATLVWASLARANFAADWKPTFNDPPVPQAESDKMEQALRHTRAVCPPSEDRRILVFSATRGYRHPSIRHGKIALERMGEHTGAYSTVVSDDPAHFEPEALAGFDAVVILNATQDFFMPSGKQRGAFSDETWKALEARQQRLVDNLIAYVRNGGGLVGIHAATDACYNHRDYGETMGGYFNGHPWNARNKVTIVIEDSEHGTIKPVFGEAEDFQLTEEIYQFKDEPYSRERLRVLLSVDPARSDKVESLKRKDNDYAVAWVQQVGEGRVFYTSIGHNPHIYWNPLMLQHYLAGIQFAAGDLPADTTPSAAGKEQP